MSFDWFTYLSETGAEIAPPKLFKHVERSLESVVRPDHTLEVDYSFMQELDDCPTTAVWWPAEVVLVSGFMIRLRLCEPETYFNHSHSRPRPLTSKLASVGEFWFDTKGPNWSVIRYIKLSDDLHSWTVPHFIRPYLIPDYLDETKINWIETEWGRSVQMRSAPRIFFEQRVLYAYELIRIGGYLECEHELDPNCVWPVKVMQNWGGRVHLEWFGADSRRSSSSSWASVQKSAFNANDECGASHDLPNKDLSNLSSLSSTSFTLFYLHRRLHPIGWGKSYALRYCPPTGLYLDRSISNIDAFIRTAPLAICSPAIFENIADTRLLRFGHPSFNEEPFLHEFKVGWKLEAVNPRNPSVIQPATVVKIFNNRYFLVELDCIEETSLLLNPISSSSPDAPSTLTTVTDSTSCVAVLSTSATTPPFISSADCPVPVSASSCISPSTPFSLKYSSTSDTSADPTYTLSSSQTHSCFHSSTISLPPPIRFVAHAGMPEIMPASASQFRGLHLLPPFGWPSDRHFTWTTYLTLIAAGIIVERASRSCTVNNSGLIGNCCVTTNSSTNLLNHLGHQLVGTGASTLSPAHSILSKHFPVTYSQHQQHPQNPHQQSTLPNSSFHSHPSSAPSSHTSSSLLDAVIRSGIGSVSGNGAEFTSRLAFCPSELAFRGVQMSSFQHTSSRDSFETISQTLSLPLLPSNGPDTDSSSSVTTNRLADVIATPTNGDYLAPANFRPLPAPVSFRPVRDSHLRGARLLTADAPPACRASSGLGQFLLGMKLETVVPEDLRSPDDIETTPLCLATITRVQNNLLWLLPDLPQTRLSFRQQSCDDLSYSTHGQQHSPLLVSIHSTKIFPFGWSELVNHPLILPSGYEEIDYHTQAPINADCKKVFLPQVSGGPTNVTPPRANRRSGDSDTLISDGDDRNRSFSSTENDIIASYFHRGPVRRPHSHFSRMEYGRTSRFEGSGTKEDEAKAIESSTASSTSSDSARSRQRRSTSNMRKLQHYQQPPFLLENELKSNYTEDGLKPLEESKYFHLSMGRGYDDTEPPVDLEISRLRQATPVVDQESITAHRYAVASCLSGYLALKEEEEHCPPIFINSRCHLGPFLCKASVELIPRRLGSGPVVRVMHSLITRLVAAAYKPLRVLRMFEADWATGLSTTLRQSGLNSNPSSSAITTGGIQFGKGIAGDLTSNSGDLASSTTCIRRGSSGRGGMHAGQTHLAANSPAAHRLLSQAFNEVAEQRREGMRLVLVGYKCPRRGVRITMPVEVCCRRRAVDEFCRQVSLLLEACPHFISLHPVPQAPAGGGVPEARLNSLLVSPSLPPSVMLAFTSPDSDSPLSGLPLPTGSNISSSTVVSLLSPLASSAPVKTGYHISADSSLESDSNFCSNNPNTDVNINSSSGTYLDNGTNSLTLNSSNSSNSLNKQSFTSEVRPTIPGTCLSYNGLFDCPSFCTSRLRSKYLDRLPGCKRRLYSGARLPGSATTAAAVQIGLHAGQLTLTTLASAHLPAGAVGSSFGSNGNAVRTRAAAAAAQRLIQREQQQLQQQQQQLYPQKHPIESRRSPLGEMDGHSCLLTNEYPQVHEAIGQKLSKILLLNHA